MWDLILKQSKDNSNSPSVSTFVSRAELSSTLIKSQPFYLQTRSHLLLPIRGQYSTVFFLCIVITHFNVSSAISLSTQTCYCLFDAVCWIVYSKCFPLSSHTFLYHFTQRSCFFPLSITFPLPPFMIMLLPYSSIKMSFSKLPRTSTLTSKING